MPLLKSLFFCIELLFGVWISHKRVNAGDKYKSTVSNVHVILYKGVHLKESGVLKVGMTVKMLCDVKQSRRFARAAEAENNKASSC